MSEKTEIERLDELWQGVEEAEGLAGRSVEFAFFATHLGNLWPEIKAVLEATGQSYCEDADCDQCRGMDDLNAAIRRELGSEGGS